MSSFEFNKIAGAVLGTLLLVMGLGIVAETIFHRDALEQKGYVVALPEEDGVTEVAEVEEVIEPIAVRLASASVSAGESLSRRCAACHNFVDGGANKVGPNLWGVVLATAGQHAGFSYSSAMAAYGAENQWTYKNLDGFLENPKGWVEGTSMSYAGLKDPADRADMILYLRSLAATPADLPVVEAAAPADGEAQSTE